MGGAPVTIKRRGRGSIPVLGDISIRETFYSKEFFKKRVK
jgi:hypothetical protein